MLFLRVFDFVVADAAQRLGEHHDASGCPRARPPPHRAADRKAGGCTVPAVSRIASSQKSISGGWKGTGSMFQIFDHSTVQLLLARKTLARVARFLEHLRQHAGVEIALIQRGLAAADHCRDDARETS